MKKIILFMTKNITLIELQYNDSPMNKLIWNIIYQTEFNVNDIE